MEGRIIPCCTGMACRL